VLLLKKNVDAGRWRFCEEAQLFEKYGGTIFSNKTKSPVYFMVIGAIPSFNITGFSRQPLLTT
jgi:hypothetical protein